MPLVVSSEAIAAIKSVIDTGDVSLAERRLMYKERTGHRLLVPPTPDWEIPDGINDMRYMHDEDLITAIAATDDDDDDLFVTNVNLILSSGVELVD